MPPLNGIDRGIDGNLLKALEESGHEDRIAIVDPSYSIPLGSIIVSYHGDSSKALDGVLDLVPIEKSELVVIMGSDPDSAKLSVIGKDFEDILMARDIDYEYRYRMTDEVEVGFYDLVNKGSLERTTLFVRTRDERAYACATFIVGHSQEI